MRSRPVLLFLVLFIAIGCTSTTVTTPSKALASAPPSTFCDPQPCASDTPNWANCAGGACPGADDQCHDNAQPCTSPGPPTSPPNPNLNCDGGPPGRTCPDGLPPIARVPTTTTCTPSATPCDIGPGTPGQFQFAVIGDWGDNCCRPSCAGFVADMIKGWRDTWSLDFIMTTGDNFYPGGAQPAVDANMAMYDWIAPQPFAGSVPRFFPALGNHDLYRNCGKAYLDYFLFFGGNDPNLSSPSGTARYYRYSLPGGIIDLFSINADDTEPDGNTICGAQAAWLQQQLQMSQAVWKIVFFHEPPYCTHRGAQSYKMRWPFKDWGADIVLTGHVHAYERLTQDGLTYVSNGIGGVKGVDYIGDPAEQGNCTPTEGSVVRYNGSVGAMIGVATEDELRFCLLAVDRNHPNGVCVDRFSLTK